MHCILANAGTPLMWAGMLHLLFGNFLIGILEGWIIYRFFKPRAPVLVFSLAILANYVSAWAGYYVLGAISDGSPRWLLGDAPLLHLRRAYLTLILIAFVVSLIIEFPFFAGAIVGKQTPHPWRRSIVGVLVVNVCSYAILLVWYNGPSRNTLGDFNLRATLEQVRLPGYWLYFLGDEDGQVYRLRLDGSPPQRVYSINTRWIDHQWDFPVLDVEPTASPGRLELVLGSFQHEPSHVAFIEGLSSATRAEGGRSQWYNHSEDFRPQEPAPDWAFTAGGWAVEGLVAESRKTHESLNVAVEVPFFMWRSALPTALPGDLVLFQLGPQIVLLDPERRMLYFVARGQSPLVLRDSAHSEPHETQPTTLPE